MPLDPDRALQGAVLARLVTDATLPALIGDPPRVYDQPPDDPVYPFVQIGAVTRRGPGAGSSATGSSTSSPLPPSRASAERRRPRR